MTVTWSNEQMVTLLEVMITSQVTITSQEVIVTSPINEEMVEAFLALYYKMLWIFLLFLWRLKNDKLQNVNVGNEAARTA